VQYLPAEPVWWTETAAEVIAPDYAALANRLNLKAQLLDQPISRLSTGERQRLALLRSLSVSPSILLLDEPTAALDQSATEKVEALLRNWVQAQPRAIIWVSHDGTQRQRVATQQWRVANGVLQCQ
jgi:ABC-type iron transport system FetAB ATPase subunit